MTDKRPRIALCLYGRFQNRLSDTAGEEGAAYIRKHLLDGRLIDVFIYSQDMAREPLIRRLYANELHKAVFEPLPDFAPVIEHAGIDESLFSPIDGFRTVSNTLSFLYARGRSLSLLRERIEDGYDYDVAICCRFDLGQMPWVGRKASPYAVGEINFSEHYDTSRVYSALWDQLNMGFADQWFFSAPQNLLKLEDMLDRTLEYLRPGSQYLRWLATGITDSSSESELSNEMLKESNRRTSTLATLPISSAVHNHLIHKFFFLEQGLYSSSAFTSDFEDTAHVLFSPPGHHDQWSLYFQSEEAYFRAFSENYICVDRKSSSIPQHYKQIIYDSTLSYTDQVSSCLSQIPQELIFFDHPDTILQTWPNLGAMRHAWQRLNRRSPLDPRPLKFIKLGPMPPESSLALPWSKATRYSLPWSRKCFASQPTFWVKTSLLQILQRHRGQSFSDFESTHHKTVRRLMLRGIALSNGASTHPSKNGTIPIFPYHSH